MRVHPTAAGSGPLVLVVGAAVRDRSADDQRGWRLGGAVAYGSLTLARLGLRVRAIVGVDREAASAWELGLLAEAGIDVHLLPLASGPVIENVETARGRRQRCLAVGSPMLLSDVVTEGPVPESVLFAPVAGELSDGWLAAVPRRALVALGLQGLLRDLQPGMEVRRIPPRPSALLRRADLVGVSRDDLAPGVTVEALARAAAPETTLILTNATHGGDAFRVGSSPGEPRAARRYRAVRADGVADPTGAGDVFLAALLACRLEPALIARIGGPWLARELRFAAAAASLAVEASGILGVPDLAAVRRRLARARSRASRCVSADSRRGSGRPNQA